MRVLVCGGGRKYSNLEYMKIKLRELFDVDDTVTLIHGDGDGADRLSEKALQGYFRGGFVVKTFPAQWDTYGKGAGPKRNQQMIDEGKPDFVVAFPGGRGTADMIRRAKAAGIKVIEVT